MSCSRRRLDKKQANNRRCGVHVSEGGTARHRVRISEACKYSVESVISAYSTRDSPPHVVKYVWSRSKPWCLYAADNKWCGTSRYRLQYKIRRA
jgi:hypothetical protein